MIHTVYLDGTLSYLTQVICAYLINTKEKVKASKFNSTC